MEPSQLLFSFYLRSLIEENNDRRPQHERQQKPPRKKLRKIIIAALAACGRLLVAIGTRLQRVGWNEEMKDVLEEVVRSFE
jgi:hypothetical protein